MKIYTIKEKVWIYPGATAAWHFVYVPKKESASLATLYKNVRRGFGSLKVQVTVGKTTWETSIFKDNRSQAYLLPLKKQIRDKEDIHQGDTIQYKLVIKEPLSKKTHI
jgi:hypothetical protein